MTKKEDVAGAIVIIFVFLLLMTLAFWGIMGMPIGPTKHKTEIVEIYEIEKEDNHYFLRTNSTLWPNSPMRLEPWGYKDLEGIIFVDDGDIVEFKYKITNQFLFGKHFHHTSLKILVDNSERIEPQ